MRRAAGTRHNGDVSGDEETAGEGLGTPVSPDLNPQLDALVEASGAMSVHQVTFSREHGLSALIWNGHQVEYWAYPGGQSPQKTDEDFASEWVLFQGASPDRFPLGDVDAGIQAAGDACPDALATSTPTPSGRLLTVVHCPSADAALGSFFDGSAITPPSDLYSADFLTTQLGVAGGASPDGRVWEVNLALEAPEVGVASILTTAYGPGNGAECEVPVVDLPVGGKLVPVEPGMPCTNRADAGLTETFDPMTVNAEVVSNAIIQIRQDRELLQQLSIRVIDGNPPSLRPMTRNGASRSPWADVDGPRH